MPPAQIVLTVNASLAIEKDGHDSSSLEVLFDSTAQPLPTGARSSLIGDRQVLYRLGSVYVDMEFESQADSRRWLVVGQMLDSARPGRPLTGIHISLLERGRNIARTTSNDNGEFRLEFDPSTELKLELFIDRRHPVHLPLVLAQSQGAQSTKKRKASAGVSEYSMVGPT